MMYKWKKINSEEKNNFKEKKHRKWQVIQAKCGLLVTQFDSTL